MKNLLLKVDEEFFFKMKEHKAILEKELEKLLNWEQYIKILFGMK